MSQNGIHMKSNVKHNKIRNTGILFELLVRKITSDALENRSNDTAIKLMREFFNSKTELGKELLLYRAVFNVQQMSEEKAFHLVGIITDQRKKLNEKALNIQKYNLIKEIKNHYDSNQTIPASQIVFPENGVLFSGSDFNVRKIFEYSYPVNKKFQDLKLDSTFYIDKNNNCITLNKDINEGTFYDSFSIPAGLDIISSKVEWNFDTRIQVSFSDTGVDGTWIVLENGKPLPEYVLGDGTNEGSKTIYFRVYMWTSDQNVLMPQLNELNFYFYYYWVFPV